MTSAPSDTAATSARIPEDAVERLRRRLGVPSTFLSKPWSTQATLDTIRQHALSKGDDNPLFCSDAYGRESVWGSVIAAPVFAQVIAEPYPVEVTPEHRALMKGDPLAGISAYMSGNEFEFWNPIVPGDRVRGLSALTAVQEKRSEYAGRTILTWNGTIYAKGNGTPVSLRNFVFVNAERDTAAKKGKYADIERAHYDDAMLAEIDAAYEAETIRGPEPRYFDDVQVGDELPRMVRGPLLIADIIATHMSHGPGFYGALLSTKLAYKNRKRVAKFYSRNPFGAWDSAQRCHWEDAWAQRVGQPFAYDYGYMRDDWTLTAITNWAGDNSWLWKYRSSIRKFNYIGDTHWFTGSVVDKKEVDGHAVAVIELSGTNQRGVATITAHAEVILPRRGDTGRIRLPTPPAGRDPHEMLQSIVKREE